MSSKLNKVVLTAHITTSVGWFGSVIVFLALAIFSLLSVSLMETKAGLIAMDVTAWFVIVPFCLLSLITGIIQATGSRWGLFKHYWIIVKLILTVGSTLLLLLHLQPISQMANEALLPNFSKGNLETGTMDMISKAGASIMVLLVLTTISIYKPWGKIQLINKSVAMEKNTSKKSWSFYILIGLVSLIIIFIVSHFLGGGMKSH